MSVDVTVSVIRMAMCIFLYDGEEQSQVFYFCYFYWHNFNILTKGQ